MKSLYVASAQLRQCACMQKQAWPHSAAGVWLCVCGSCWPRPRRSLGTLGSRPRPPTTQATASAPTRCAPGTRRRPWQTRCAAMPVCRAAGAGGAGVRGALLVLAVHSRCWRARSAAGAGLASVECCGLGLPAWRAANTFPAAIAPCPGHGYFQHEQQHTITTNSQFYRCCRTRRLKPRSSSARRSGASVPPLSAHTPFHQHQHTQVLQDKAFEAKVLECTPLGRMGPTSQRAHSFSPTPTQPGAARQGV